MDTVTIATGHSLELFEARKAAEAAYLAAVTPHEQATAHAAHREICEEFSRSLDRAYAAWRDGARRKVQHLAVFEAEADAETFEARLTTLTVPGVTRYGNRVQVAIPADTSEGDHWRALLALARTVTENFRLGRVSG